MAGPLALVGSTWRSPNTYPTAGIRRGTATSSSTSNGTTSTAPVTPDMSVEVDDVEAAYVVMRDSGAEIVHPLQDEEWGVRRFFVRDPNGRVVNVLSHR
ncbi:MAG: VOC family protein [Carbonactinosporaceae bacterium]